MSGTDRVMTADHNRERLLECAGACLDHIRNVRWGEGTAHYTVEDDGYLLDVLVQVRCNRKAEASKA